MYNGTINCTKGTFSDLNDKIDKSNGELNLTYNFTYTPEIDGAYVNGIVINKNIIINANASVIDANNITRIFNVTSTLTLNNATLTNANASKGAAIYVNKNNVAYINYVNFTNNTAETRGGAIYSEGTVEVNNSVFDSNDITYRGANVDNGGAAIYNLDGSLTVKILYLLIILKILF